MPFMDPDLPLADRVRDLIDRMTLAEKVGQTMHKAPSIPRLGVPAYNWWNECLHGVGRAGGATVFPQAIGMAASFNPVLMHQVATALSDEARAKHHQRIATGDCDQYFGLTYWSPNVNIFRDPRWGRGQETYGEDPHLSARMGVAFCKGLQGDDPKYLKLVATPKHYAVHSGPEPERHGFDAVVTGRDLRETYLPAFKACVKEAGAFSVMGAYNRTNGEPCCASRTLLQDILRDEWGFKGYVVSDCGAICDIHKHHQVTADAAESAALAVKNGCELNCGGVYASLLAAVDAGLITEPEIDVALTRLFTARFRLGMFDPPERVPYASIPSSTVNCDAHRALARQMARESIVLLKNTHSILPLGRENLRTIAVIGPTATDIQPLLGNYYGFSRRLVTPLEGIVGAVPPGMQVNYAKGCELAGTQPIDAALIGWQVGEADVIVAVVGGSPALEGEEGEVAASDGGGDRLRIGLPGRQEELLQHLRDTGKPLVVVLTGGSPMAINWVEENADAALMLWYPGEEGGNAIADVLFGDCNPGGRLPVTFVKNMDQLPPFRDYAMTGRTYRFMDETPLYPFGYGLSYTTFVYADLQTDTAQVSVSVTNTGDCAGDEVVQLYLRHENAPVPVPRHHLEGFVRITLQPGETRRVTFALQPEQFACYTDDGIPILGPGSHTVYVGGGQPDTPGATGVVGTIERTA